MDYTYFIYTCLGNQVIEFSHKTHCSMNLILKNCKDHGLKNIYMNFFFIIDKKKGWWWWMNEFFIGKIDDYRLPFE
jgi:hypothetical protein